MTQYLPPSLLQMFAARPPIPYIQPAEKKTQATYSGIGQYIQFFEDPKTVDQSQFKPIETKDQIKARKRKEKQEKEEEKIQKLVKNWDPHNNPKATQDAYKTLFVSRINFDTSEKTLKREFEDYGPIKRLRLIRDLDGKSRGYAFIEFERERDMKTAYKQADGKKIDGKRVLVDVERGRTVRGWRARKFGGGLGATRAGGPEVNRKWSGREPPTPLQEKEREREDRNDRERAERERGDRGDRGERGDRGGDRGRDFRGDRGGHRFEDDRGDYKRSRPYRDFDRDNERDKRNRYHDRDRYV
eukprot:TRINITY_DN622_c0_g1_i1.p1 TRINITY_DN622_c0_g1~~TRINITY_DN622_c0_g1_i1.p1  ORF type:complete len:337 (-),score=70.85 TRINITY_DN622_c0_g1_i1:172-1071(-)